MNRVRLTDEEKKRLSKVNLKRVYLPPKWTGVFENYSRQWVNKNYWRVTHYFDSREDALAGCALTFSRCLSKYKNTVDNHRWFMALYKRALFNDWNTFSVKDTRQRAFLTHDFDTTTDTFALTYSQIEYHSGDTLLTVQQAPPHVRSLLNVLAHASAEFVTYIFEGEDEPSVNRRLCNAAGIRECNALQAIKQLFEEGTHA